MERFDGIWVGDIGGNSAGTGAVLLLKLGAKSLGRGAIQIRGNHVGARFSHCVAVLFT